MPGAMESPTPAFWSRARAHPERVALIADDGSAVRAGDLLADAQRLVHGLRARGLRQGDILAVALGNVPAFFACYLAAMQAGWYFAPLNTGLAPPELAAILRDAGARALVFGPRAADAVRMARAQGCAPASFALEACEDFPTWAALLAGQPATAPDDQACGEKLYYTSGTSGRPCQVRKPLGGGSPEACGAAAAAHLGAMAGIVPDSGLVHLVASPLYHSASLLWASDHLHLGHRLVLMERWDARGALARIARHRVTGGFLVPTHFHRLLALPDAERAAADVSSLRHVIHGGAPCPVARKRRMLAWWGDVVYEVYGAAEGGGLGISPAAWREHPGSVGQVGEVVRVLREDGTPCAAGEQGTVYLRLRQPFVYHGAPAKTAAAQRDGWFTVGDLGRLDEEGYLYLEGRRSDTIISGGVNVHPAEVEAALREHPAVADAAVFGVPDPEWGERVCAALELASGRADGLEEELRAFLGARLAGAKRPKTLVFPPALPRRANGKLDRAGLRALVEVTA